VELPDRTGWMEGELAKKPASPPFPEFTDFERRALDCIAPIFGELESDFRGQVAGATVTDRINTIVGFYTRVKVDRSKCKPVPIRAKGAQFEVRCVEHGIGVVLWDVDGDGFLETIEGYTVDEDPLRNIELRNIEFVRMEQLG
jgi:hypothetical protein